MLSDLQLVYMVPSNSTQLLKINTTKFQVEREPVKVIIIAPLTVRFGLCRLFRASGKLRIAISDHGLKRFPVMNSGSVTSGDFPQFLALHTTPS